MAYSPIEDKYLSVLTSQQFPDMPAEPVATEPSVDGVQLAEVGATKMGDYGYSGQRQPTMTDYDPTVRERMADFLQAGFEKFGMDRYKARQNAQTLIGGPSSNLPLNIGLADIIPILGTGLQTQEAVRMGGEAVTSAQQGNIGTAAMQAGGAAVGMIPGVAGTVKAGKALAPKAGEMVLDTMTKLGTPVKMGVVPESPSMAAKPAAPVNDLGFYSAVEQAAMNVQRKSGSGQAFLNDITKGENVKADEVKWIGLDEFLKGKKSVTKQEVQDYIAANKVDVQEVQLGAGTVKSFEQWASDQGLSADAIRDFGPTLRNSYEAFKNNASQKVAAAKFGQYTLPGGENYREILLTLPEKEPRNLNDIAQQMYGKRFSELGDEEANSVTRAEREEIKGGNFKSSHWNEKNVLAHIRVNDRVDADGKKMLLVEEVQSDWHQAGRDKGYKNEAELEAKFAPLAQEHRAIVERRADIVAKPGMEEEYKSLAKREQQLIDEMNKLHDTKQYGVPDAPMKDTWYQLALKRVLKYAADNGYERVGLTTGSRQAERFDLSKQVDEIAVPMVNAADGTRSVRIDPTEGTSIKLMVDKDGMVTGYGAGSTQFSGKKLNEVIGKEMADKVMKAEADAKFSGLDLKVGGEGMKKYYDEIYPTYLQKYGKKWGAKVGETTIETGRSSDAAGIPSMYKDKEPVRFVDITPEMRKSVGKGQPLFSATAAGAGAAATMQDKENK
jgi:hypothetical protein